MIMALLNVLSVRTRPEKAQEYEALVADLAQQARDAGESFRWTAHQVIMGDTGVIHFASQVQDFNAMAERGQSPEMVARVLGEARAEQAMRAFGACSQEVRVSVFTDRPDLSYQPDQGGAMSPATVSTTIRARNGQFEACEELLRKLAEAIPKVGDSARMIAWQPVIGQLGQYVVLRPIESLADLDQQQSPPDLLSGAFGPAEGGLIYRSGLEAIESAERDVLLLRPDLSNQE
jgi:quinol monooxygenase YgiN